MTRLRKSESRVRLSLETSKQVRDRLEVLRVRTGADSLTEVVRRAVAVYDALLTRTANGAKVVLRQSDGSEQELLLSS